MILYRFYGELLLHSMPDIIDPCMQKLIGRVHDTQAVKQVFVELLANAITHGNQEDPLKKIEVMLREESQFYIQISNEGEGFDFESTLKHSNPSKSATHGRGLLLIKELGFKIRFLQAGRMVLLEIPKEQ